MSAAEEDTWGGRCKRRPLEFLRCMRREAAGKRKQQTGKLMRIRTFYYLPPKAGFNWRGPARR